MEGKNTVFLFTDTQIIQESFLEDINNILNSGEVRSGVRGGFRAEWEWGWKSLWGERTAHSIDPALSPDSFHGSCPFTSLSHSPIHSHLHRSPT